MTRRKFLRLMKSALNDSRDAVIRYLTAQLKWIQKHLSKRPIPSNNEKAMLSRVAKAVDQAWLERSFNFFQPSTLFRWYRELILKKWDYSHLQPKKSGRPRVDRELEELVVQLALENPHDGFSTIVGRLKILGMETNEQTVKNILQRNGIPSSPDRKEGMSWQEFIDTHWDTLIATDFFTWEVLAPYGLVTYYVLFFIRLKDRKVHIAGLTTNPNGNWMAQVARNLTDPEDGFLKSGETLIHDRGGQYCPHFKRILEEAVIRCQALPPQSPNLNAFAERFVRTVKDQCLSRLLVTSEEGLRKALKEFAEHYHHERPHQGIGNVIPLPRPEDRIGDRNGRIMKKSRLGSLLNFYHREGNTDGTMLSPEEMTS